MSKATVAVRAFFRWWFGELAGCVPARLCRRRDAGPAICVPADVALTTRFSLPLAAEPNLADVVRFELDRRTPFSADQVHFAHRIVARDDSRIEVALTVAPKAAVADAFARAHAAGIKTVAIDVGGEPVSLLPDAAPPRRSRVLVRAACVAALLGGAFLAYQPVEEAAARAAALQRQIAAARAAADATVQQKEQLAKASDAARFLTARRQAIPSVSELLAELSRVLPDNTYLVQLNLREAELQVAGFSAATSELFPLIDRSSLLAEPKFRSAVVLDQAEGRERFEIGAKILRKVMQ